MLKDCSKLFFISMSLAFKSGKFFTVLPSGFISDNCDKVFNVTLDLPLIRCNVV